MEIIEWKINFGQGPWGGDPYKVANRTPESPFPRDGAPGTWQGHSRQGAWRGDEPMKETAVIVVLLLVFAVSHMLLSSRSIRAGLVARLGDRRFLVAYSLVAFATFGPLVYYYIAHRHAGPLLWSVPGSGTVEFLLVLANVIGAVLLVAGVMTPSRPRSPERRSTSRGACTGSRVTRCSWHGHLGPRSSRRERLCERHRVLRRNRRVRPRRLLAQDRRSSPGATRASSGSTPPPPSSRSRAGARCAA